MKLPKKPKAKKFPKKPSQKASIEVWERYYKRCEQIKKDNEKALKEWKNKIKKLKSDEEKKKKLIEKARHLSNK